MKQEMVGGSGISCTICKSLTPASWQITMPVCHYSDFTGQIPFLSPKASKQWRHI